jgi:uncharacterized membrane protein (UPF0127 family)
VKVVALTTRQCVFCARCSVASTPFARMRGLLGRAGLASGEGLLLRPASSVHTFFMRFAIDVVFLDRHGVVLKVVDALAPWRTAGCRGAKAVVELPAGEAAKQGIQRGRRLDMPLPSVSSPGPAAGLPPFPA